MYLVGDVPLKARRLVEVTYEAMMQGIAQARPDNRIGDIGHAIERFVARYRYGIVRDFCALDCEFAAAFEELVVLDRNQRHALRCSEAVW